MELEILCKLWFSGERDISLSRFSISHPLLGEERISHRGTTSLFTDSPYTFQWTKAVKALALLLVQCAEKSISEKQPHRTHVYLSGGQNSLASALDYALSKKPGWMEIFAIPEKHASILPRLFLRANPNRKRKGKVIIAPSPSLREPKRILVHLNGSLLTTSAALRRVCLCLKEEARHIEIVEAGTSGSTGETSPPTLQENFFPILHKEVLRALNERDIFSSQTEEKKLLDALHHASFRSIAGDSAEKLAQIKIPLLPSEQLGILHPLHFKHLHCLKGRAITASVPITTPASALILEYLGKTTGCSLKVDHSYPHAVEILHSLKHYRTSPDFLALGFAPAAKLLRDPSLEYYPLSFLPSLQHEALSAASTLQDSIAGTYHLLDESTALFHYQDMVRRKLLPNDHGRLSFSQPWEALQRLLTGDPEARTILFFPYSEIAKKLHSVHSLQTPHDKVFQEMILFVHKRIAHNESTRRALHVAVRHSWLELRAKIGANSFPLRGFMERHALINVMGRYG